ncbi:15888_t:CDS:1 [Racocetra persica]|uniref:15888_t:CDS:1 n=1 Tax=Racocetra persica TaxID=160502 RepID=A0ACA9LDF0_9GLOM|nr:15888_t:CDS:1 [Racocetra persica]
MSQSDSNQNDAPELKSYNSNLLFDSTTSLSKHVFETSLEKICSNDNAKRSIFLSKLKKFFEFQFEEMNKIEANSKLVHDRNDSNFSKATIFKDKILRGPMYGVRQQRDYVTGAYFEHLTKLEKKQLESN